MVFSDYTILCQVYALWRGLTEPLLTNLENVLVKSVYPPQYTPLNK